MRFSVTLLVFSCIFLMVSEAANASDRDEFTALFEHWTTAFNHKDLSATCALFAKNVSANYRGTPRKNYASICGGFKKIFHDPNKQYRYQFRLHQIYRSQNLAAVRITWYLQMLEKGKSLVHTQDEGLDVMRKNQGQWQIVNYVGYQV